MQQMGSTFDLEMFKTEMDLKKNEVKQAQKLWTHDQLRLRDEVEREVRKAQCEVIEISEDGKVIARTQNLRINAVPRAITNVLNPEMIKLVNASDPFEFVWMFVGLVNSEWKQVFLAPGRIDSASYLSKKMSGLGIEFYAHTYMDEKWMMRKFARKLIRESSRFKWIPENIGWYVDEDQSTKFYMRGDLTWSYVIEKIR